MDISGTGKTIVEKSRPAPSTLADMAFLELFRMDETASLASILSPILRPCRALERSHRCDRIRYPARFRESGHRTPRLSRASR